jgi:hypothetical protein
MEVKPRYTKMCRVRIRAHFSSKELAKEILRNLRWREIVVTETFDYDIELGMITCQINAKIIHGTSLSKKLQSAENELMRTAEKVAKRYLELHPDAPITPLPTARMKSKGRKPEYLNQQRTPRRTGTGNVKLHSVRR